MRPNSFRHLQVYGRRVNAPRRLMMVERVDEKWGSCVGWARCRDQTSVRVWPNWRPGRSLLKVVTFIQSMIPSKMRWREGGQPF